MAEFDARKPGAYLGHLSAVNRDRAVTTFRGIHNDQGALVVGTGTRIDSATAKKILRHRLQESLDACVAVDGALNANELRKAFESLAAESPELARIHKGMNLRRTLRKLCKACQKYPILLQKITVLSLRFPNDFRISLFSAWFGVAISRRMRRNENEMLAVFLGGLCQDIGMLHLDESVSRKTDHTIRELKLLRGHPLIGRKLLEIIDGLPAGMCRAVAEHHERHDGTGYPRNLLVTELSVAGQILAVANDAARLRFNPDPEWRRSLAAFVPACMLLSTVSITEVVRVTVGMLRDLLGSRDALEAECAEMQPIAEHVQEVNESLLEWYGLLAEVPAALEQAPTTRNGMAGRVILEHIHFAAAACGVFSDPARRWLREVVGGGAGARATDLEEFGALQEAMHHHLQQLSQNLRLAVAGDLDEGCPPGAAQLEALVARMQALDAGLSKCQSMDERDGSPDDDEFLIEI